MKKKIRSLCMLTFCFLVFLTVPAIAQDSNEPNQSINLQAQTVNAELPNGLEAPEDVSVIFGKTQAIKIYATYEDGSRVDVTRLATLESSDTETVTVTGGIIKGISVGEATVTATYLEQYVDIYVTVTMPVTKLSADATVLDLMVEEETTINLTATYTDGNTGDVAGSSVKWKSSSPKVATVDGDGVVTGVANGSTKITGSFGGKTATVTVNVTAAVDHFLVQPSKVSVAKGKTQAVIIYAVYEDGSKADITKAVRLTSQDTDVATVTGAVIKGITAGYETEVIGSYMDNDIVIPVQVTQALKSIKADTDTSGLNLYVDGTETITLSATYADGSTEEDVNEFTTVSSGKPSVATVENIDGVITVTGVAKGSTTITLSYGGKKVTVKVKVTE